MKLDLHIHSEKSRDGCMPREQIAQIAKSKGISAVAVCDHGISPEKKDIDEPFVDGVLIIPAIEYSTKVGHLLGLFLASPVGLCDTKRVDFAAAAREIHNAGGIAILAHPFENAKDFAARRAEIETLLPHIDGIEVFNSRADYKYGGANAAAEEFAREHGITLVTAGSDAHTPSEIGGAITNVDCVCDIESIKTALIAGGKTSGKNAKRACIGISQINRAKYYKSFSKYVTALAFYCYMKFKDLKDILKK